MRDSGGCRTAKVKVAEPGQSTRRRRRARARPSRRALDRRAGAAARVRVDANGAWTVSVAVRRSRRCAAAARRRCGAGVRRAAVRHAGRAGRGAPPRRRPDRHRRGAAQGRRPRRTSRGCARPRTSSSSRSPRSAASRRPCEVAAGVRAAGGRLERPRLLRRPGRRRRARRRAGHAGPRLRAGLGPAARAPTSSRRPTGSCPSTASVPGGSARPGRGSARTAAGRTRSRAVVALAAGRRVRDHGRAMNPSTALGRVVVDELVRAGVREAVLAPGSRSAPIALALHDAGAARPAAPARAHRRALRGVHRAGPGQGGRPARRRAHHQRARPRPTCTRRCWRRARAVCRSSCSPPTGRPSCAATGANQTVDQVGDVRHGGPALPRGGCSARLAPDRSRTGARWSAGRSPRRPGRPRTTRARCT